VTAAPSTPVIALGPALRGYVTAELQSAMAGLGARGGRIHAGVHLARKAIRRTRAVLALGRTTLGPGAAPIDRELRRVNRSLSTLRDAHALVETLDRLAAKPHDAVMTRRLRRARRVAATRRASCARTQIDGKPERARAMLAMLQAALQGLPWQTLSSSTLTDALDLTLHGIAEARADACTTGRNRDWHRWRRRMRRMSQQHTACAAVGLEFSEPLFDKSLAEQLGKAQDLDLLLEHCSQGSPFSKPDRAALRAFAKSALARQRKRIASVSEHAAVGSHSPSHVV
jgi:CHAD domain-containing protein